MKKLLTMLLCMLMMLSAFSGCAGEDTPSVYWLNFKPEADEALQEIAKTYTEETGVTVRVVTAASGTYEQTLTAEMDKSNAPTLFVVGNAAAVNQWENYCYDLSESDVYQELTTDAFTLRNADGKVCSIGYCYESFGIIVNKTLLAKAGYQLSAIRDFVSLKTVAEDIHARAEQLGFDAFTSSGLDDSSSWRFSGHLANMPLYYEGRDKAWTACPATVEGTYLDNFRNIWDLYMENSAYDPRTLATGGYDAKQEFISRKAVFYQNGTWEYAGLVEGGIQSEELAMIPIYCGVEGEEKAGLCSGTENCWAVNAKASDVDIQATLDFMKWMVTSEKGTKCMAEQFGAIPYKKAAKNENVFFNDAANYLSAGNYSVDWTFNYTPNVNDWRAALVSAMVQYCSGGDWSAVETAFTDGWAEQYKKANS